jgi:hypothetical protein
VYTPDTILVAGAVGSEIVSVEAWFEASIFAAARSLNAWMADAFVLM